MRKIKPFLLLLVVLAITSIPVCAEDTKWFGAVFLKSNYVVSTGLELDDGPVSQLWARGQYANGFYVDVFATMPLTSGNPNNAREIDWSVGYRHSVGDGQLDYQLSYYDVERPDLFDNDGDVLVPKIRYTTGRYFFEAVYFQWDRARDAVRIGGGARYSFSDDWNLIGQINYVDGPFSSQKVVIPKLRITRQTPAIWLDSIFIEVFDLLYQENPDDRRGFTVTFAVSKSF